MEPGIHSRLPSGILGLLCKLHYPGIVVVDGREQPAWSWDHYISAQDIGSDADGQPYGSKARRVVSELFVSGLRMIFNIIIAMITAITKQI